MIKHIILLFTFIFTFIYSQDIQKFAELSALKHCPFLNFNGFTCPIKTPISENNINIIGGLGFSTVQQTTKLPIYKSEKAVEIYEEKYEYSEFNKVSGPKSIINHRKLLKQLNNLFIIMKSRDVLKILQISRSTLYHYVRDRKIFVTKLDNGYYDYDEDCIFKLLKKDSRYNVIYARVSTYKQKNDLSNQVTFIQDYCKNNNIVIETIYSEISSGIDLDRIEFNKLMDLVIHMKIKNIYISNKDRLTRLSFKTLEYLFSKFGTQIIIINQDPHKVNDNEIFEELLSLLHIFLTTMYSNRRKNKLNIYKQDIENFITEEK